MNAPRRELDVYALDSLIGLLKRSVVRVFAGEANGTGFFIAPGLVLTCSHVIPNKTDPISIQWSNQKPVDGQLLVKMDLNQPDLALVQVTIPSDSQPPCVLPGEEVLLNDPLYTFGHPEGEYAVNGDPVTFNSEDFAVDKYGNGVLKMKSGQSSPGLSGSPVLNQRTGCVCGVVMTTRDPYSDLGGRAVPIKYAFGLRETLRDDNANYHRMESGWTSLISRRASAKAIRFASNQDEPRADFLIVAPAADQWRKLLARLPDAATSEDSGFVFARSKVPFTRENGSTGSYHVIVARPSEAHSTDPAITRGAMQRFRPYCLITCATGGGVVKNGVQLGDIVVANAIVVHEVRTISTRRFEIQP